MQISELLPLILLSENCNAKFLSPNLILRVTVDRSKRRSILSLVFIVKNSIASPTFRLKILPKLKKTCSISAVFLLATDVK